MSEVDNSEDMVKSATLGLILRLVEMVSSNQLTPMQGTRLLSVVFSSFNRFILDRDLVELVTEADTEFTSLHKPRCILIYTFESTSKVVEVRIEGLNVKMTSEGKVITDTTLETEVELGGYFESLSNRLVAKGFMKT